MKLRLTPHTRKMAIQSIMDAPDGYVFTAPKEPTRSLEQNARLWAMLTDVSKQVEWPVNGVNQHLTPDDWKGIISASLDQENRMAAGIRGGFVMLGKRTSKMTIREMTEMIEFLFSFGDERNVKWSEKFDVPEWVR